ncbi:hypothetical protein RHSIM_Rhsim12G0009200 [Rhododendron simsii]|uniref:F-box protein n=1 Tax=Rhododendron simsii TaxID=118357 RepID=A0A834G2U6_RHOSS|nr:hypothetical protein RHSIM_Rhsim12G0009200 [Rhododendron simsii]
MSVDGRLDAGEDREFNRMRMLEGAGVGASSNWDCFGRNLMAGSELENRLTGVQLEDAWHLQIAVQYGDYGNFYSFDAEKASLSDDVLAKPMICACGILGSCNGLFLVSHNSSDYTDLYLWNPTIRQSAKVLSILMDQRLFPRYGSLVPLCLTKNGEILVLVDGDEFLVYNPDKMSQRDIHIRFQTSGCRFYFRSYGASYVESLASPAAYGREKDWIVKGSHATHLLCRTRWRCHSYESHSYESYDDSVSVTYTEDDNSVQEHDDCRCYALCIPNAGTFGFVFHRQSEGSLLRVYFEFIIKPNVFRS